MRCRGGDVVCLEEPIRLVFIGDKCLKERMIGKGNGMCFGPLAQLLDGRECLLHGKAIIQAADGHGALFPLIRRHVWEPSSSCDCVVFDVEIIDGEIENGLVGLGPRPQDAGAVPLGRCGAWVLVGFDEYSGRLIGHLFASMCLEFPSLFGSFSLGPCVQYHHRYNR